jgi:hypothetical protein
MRLPESLRLRIAQTTSSSVKSGCPSISQEIAVSDHFYDARHRLYGLGCDCDKLGTIARRPDECAIF